MFIAGHPVLGDPQSNIEKLVEVVTGGLSQNPGIDLVFTPELALSGYLLENLTVSSAMQPDDKKLEPLFKLSEQVDLLIGLPLAENGNIYNSAMYLRGGKVLAKHNKIYLPTYGFFDEARYFQGGNELETFQGPLGHTAILICEDMFHPALVYALYEKGVRHLFVPSCSPARGVESDEEENLPASTIRWRKRLEVYAESFGFHIYYLNRSGSEDGVFFDGSIMVVSPDEKTSSWSSLDQSSENSESYRVVSIDRNEIKSAITHGGPSRNELWDLNYRFMTEAHRKKRGGKQGGE